MGIIALVFLINVEHPTVTCCKKRDTWMCLGEGGGGNGERSNIAFKRSCLDEEEEVVEEGHWAANLGDKSACLHAL